MVDVLSAPVRDVIALYSAKYPDVRFPELDLGVLEAAAQNVADAATRVVEAEATIEPLRQEVRLAEQELTQKVAKALAFLKVYIEGDEAEYARLDALTQALLARRPQRRSNESTPANGERSRARGKKARSMAEVAADGFEPPMSASEIAEVDLPNSALSQFEPASICDLPA